jgi:hypothetical protein
MSYIIVSKETGKGVFELYDARNIKLVNKDLYIVMSSYDYLCKLNKDVRNENTH